MKSSSAGNVLGMALIGCLAIFIAFLFGGLLLMLAWNAVIPAVFGASSLDYPMALGLEFLLGFLASLLRRGGSSK